MAAATSTDPRLPDSCTEAARDPFSTRQALCETAAILLLFAFFAGQGPPAVNEAHYLCKARHFWNPDWCGRDPFLASKEAHLVFAWTVGWLAHVCALPAAAWWGRLLAWATLAWGWQRLSRAVVPRPWASVLTAGLWLALVERTAMAGEWVVGGVEAKCFAYALVVLGLEALVRQRWNAALAWCGAATSFHVLVGGWSIVALGAAWLSCGRYRPRVETLWRGAVASIVLALPGLIPAVRLTTGDDPTTVAEAEWIYVYGRLSHHLVFHRLAATDIAAHLGLLALFLTFAYATPCPVADGRLGQRPLRGFVLGAVGLAVIGAGIDQALLGQWELSAKLLRYYWFRMSDAFLPLGGSLVVVAAAVRWRPSRPRLARVLIVAASLASLVNLVEGSYRHGMLAPRGLDPQWNALVRFDLVQPAELATIGAEWRATCDWIRRETPADSLFLTPRAQQTFKWYAERAEVVNVKDIPQDAGAVVAWQFRREAVYPPATSTVGLAGHGAAGLVELARRYGAEYIVVDEHLSGRILPLPVLYPPAEREAAFRVYRVPSPAGTTP